MKAVFSRPDRPNPRPRVLESSASPKAHHVRDPDQLAPPATLFHLAPDQTRRSPPSKGFGPTTPYVWPLSNMRWETQRRRN